jgi:biopolymer transport protein ExbD
MFLQEASRRYANQGVMIRGAASLAYQDLADVLSVCDAAGIRNVRLPVRSRGETRSVTPALLPD